MTRLFAGTAFDIPPECDLCGNKETDCVCTAEQKAEAEAAKQREADRLPPSSQTAKVSLQKRKAGRVVTVVEGLTARANDLPAILAQLQSICGTGGTVKKQDDLIELQGDHATRVRDALTQQGYKVKK